MCIIHSRNIRVRNSVCLHYFRATAMLIIVLSCHEVRLAIFDLQFCQTFLLIDALYGHIWIVCPIACFVFYRHCMCSSFILRSMCPKHASFPAEGLCFIPCAYKGLFCLSLSQNTRRYWMQLAGKTNTSKACTEHERMRLLDTLNTRRKCPT